MWEATRRAIVSAGSAAMLSGASTNGRVSGDVFDLARFGVNSSNHDNGAQLQAAFDSVRERNCPTFVLPPGNYRISQPLRIRQPMTLLGSSAYDMNSSHVGSVIEGGDFSEPVLICESAIGERLRGLCVSGILFDCRNRTGGPLFRRCADFQLSRIGVRAARGFGIGFRNAWDAVIVDLFVSACGTPDGKTGAIDIVGEPLADNSNSLHFFGARVESSRGPGLIVHAAPLHAGPNNNIQFVASKFHHPAGDGTVAPTPNLVLGPAEAVSFHGTQIFDAGGDFPVIEFGYGSSADTGYAFFGCDIDVRAGAALLGGDVSRQQFFGCTLRADPAISDVKPLYHGKGGDLRRLKGMNNLYRVAA